MLPSAWPPRKRASFLHRLRDRLLLMLGIMGLLTPLGHVSALAAAASASTTSVTFTATEYSFSGPAQIDGGWQRITLVNRGRDVHQVQFLGLPQGKTLEDFRELMHAMEWARLPSWVRRHGGVNSVAPGDEATVVIHLEPGEYVLLCGIPDSQGRPHAVHDMMGPLQVRPPPSPAPAAPPADATITGTDFAYALDRPLLPGPRTLRFRNDGDQAHEVVLLRLTPGASTQDFLDAYLPGGAPNPAGTPIGGVVGIDPGRDGYMVVDLKPGRYGLLCFLGDPRSRAPHFARGMWLDLDVAAERGSGP